MKNLILAFIYLFTNTAHAVINDADKTYIFNKNLLKNGGFENGKASWTASAGTFAVTTTSPMIGKQHATWDAAASGNTLTSTAVSIPVGLYGRNGVASCLITTASGTATHTIEAYDGSNILSSVTITSSTTPTRASANFIFPSSGSISLRLYANANEPDIAIDDCYLGAAEGYNTGDVSQVQFIGSAYFATTTNCTFTRSSSTPGSLTDTDCPGPTVEFNPGPGIIQTTDTNSTAVTVNNLPPGNYEVGYSGGNQMGSNQFSSISVSDGTTTSGRAGVTGSTVASGFHVLGRFSYTSAGNRTFELFGSSASAGALNLDNASHGQQLNFYIKRFPLATELAYTPDKTANSYSGYQDSTCSWGRTNASLGDPTADASCALVTNYNTNFGTVANADSGGSALPGITFTPSRAGKYYACATFFLLASSGQQNSAQLVAGSDVLALTAATISASNIQNFNLCGIVNASSTSAITLKIQTAIASGTTTIQSSSPATHAVDWVIFQIDQSFPMPQLVGSPSYVSTTSWTPTVTGTGFGTISGAAGKYWRIGDRLYVEGTFTAGTTTANTGGVILPNSLTIDSAKLSITSNTTSNVGSSVGRWDSNAASANTGGPLITAPGTLTTAVYFATSGGNAASHITPNGTINGAISTGNVVNFKFDVPIVGW